MTLEEIGAVLDITRERVRQIKEKALSRLRHVSAGAGARELSGLIAVPRSAYRVPSAIRHLSSAMAQTSSFDVTTGVDLQEVDNAVNQAQKEVGAALRLQGRQGRPSSSSAPKA